MPTNTRQSAFSLRGSLPSRLEVVIIKRLQADTGQGAFTLLGSFPFRLEAVQIIMLAADTKHSAFYPPGSFPIRSEVVKTSRRPILDEDAKIKQSPIRCRRSAFPLSTVSSTPATLGFSRYYGFGVLERRSRRLS